MQKGFGSIFAMGVFLIANGLTGMTARSAAASSCAVFLKASQGSYGNIAANQILGQMGRGLQDLRSKNWYLNLPKGRLTLGYKLATAMGNESTQAYQKVVRGQLVILQSRNFLPKQEQGDAFFAAIGLGAEPLPALQKMEVGQNWLVNNGKSLSSGEQIFAYYTAVATGVKPEVAHSRLDTAINFNRALSRGLEGAPLRAFLVSVAMGVEASLAYTRITDGVAYVNGTKLSQGENGLALLTALAMLEK